MEPDGGRCVALAARAGGRTKFSSGGERAIEVQRFKSDAGTEEFDSDDSIIMVQSAPCALLEFHGVAKVQRNREGLIFYRPKEI